MPIKLQTADYTILPVGSERRRLPVGLAAVAPVDRGDRKQRFNGRRKTPPANYARTRQWKAARERALERAGNKCERCYETKTLEVHHIVPVRVGGAKFDQHNLLVVCRRCHWYLTVTDKRRYPELNDNQQE